MHVKLAAQHKQPRPSKPERCDNCLGFEVEGQEPPVTVQPDSTVQAYNVLVPGCGTQTFMLHPSCSETLR